MSLAPITLYFDGGARPNPGVIETAVFVAGALHFRDDHGCGSNDQAEWLALLDALAVAQMLDAHDIILRGDSMLVINQASGRTKCRSPLLQPYLDAFRTLKSDFARIRIRHIARSQNHAGIALDRRRR